jgi:hypothetical protein
MELSRRGGLRLVVGRGNFGAHAGADSGWGRFGVGSQARLGTGSPRAFALSVGEVGVQRAALRPAVSSTESSRSIERSPTWERLPSAKPARRRHLPSSHVLDAARPSSLRRGIAARLLGRFCAFTVASFAVAVRSSAHSQVREQSSAAPPTLQPRAFAGAVPGCLELIGSNRFAHRLIRRMAELSRDLE